MSERILFNIRVRYSVTGRLAMLSHLELIRALERMIRRAALPFAVTNGFSPHMKISFGSALPVGVGGENEIFDLAMTEYVDPSEVVERLRACAPYSMTIKDANYIERDEKAASIAFPISKYKAKLSRPIERLAYPDVITVMKKGKERSYIVDDYLYEDVIIAEDEILFGLISKPEGSLRPDLFLKECLKATFPDSEEVSVEITDLCRMAQLRDRMTQDRNRSN